MLNIPEPCRWKENYSSLSTCAQHPLGVAIPIVTDGTGAVPVVVLRIALWHCVHIPRDPTQPPLIPLSACLSCLSQSEKPLAEPECCAFSSAATSSLHQDAPSCTTEYSVVCRRCFEGLSEIAKGRTPATPGTSPLHRVGLSDPFSVVKALEAQIYTIKELPFSSDRPSVRSEQTWKPG